MTRPASDLLASLAEVFEGFSRIIEELEVNHEGGIGNQGRPGADGRTADEDRIYRETQAEAAAEG